MSSIWLDHLAVTCATLEEGAQWVEAELGVPLAGGGEHAAFGTHNRLLSLGPEEYLEVIAVNPAAPRPPRARWFGLDHFEGAPRLANWIAACDDLAAALAESPPGAGMRLALSRGDLRWQMAVTETGQLPFDNRFPALIHWEGPHHPAQRLPDQGVRLTGLRITHPDAAALRKALAPLLTDPRIKIVKGDSGIRASCATPKGKRQL